MTADHAARATVLAYRARQAYMRTRYPVRAVITHTANPAPAFTWNRYGARAIGAASPHRHPPSTLARVEEAMTDHTARAVEHLTAEQIRTALGGVLFNVSNYPEPAQVKMLGQDFTPLLDRATEAVINLLGIKS